MEKRRSSMLQEFREFLMQGNVMELAVAIIIGIAFGLVIQAFVNGVLMAFIAAIFGKPNFDALIAGVGDGQVLYGTFLTALMNFVIIAAALFMIVKVANRFRKPDEVIDLSEPSVEQTKLLVEIRDLLARERTKQ